VILGITSVQGAFYDGDIQEPEITFEREMELTKAFLKKHNITWPIAFSDSNVYDPRYGVLGLPTNILLDRKGRVRHFERGNLRPLIIKLLSEDQ